MDKEFDNTQVVRGLRSVDLSTVDWDTTTMQRSNQTSDCQNGCVVVQPPPAGPKIGAPVEKARNASDGGALPDAIHGALREVANLAIKNDIFIHF